MDQQTRPSLDSAEVARFDALARRFWDEDGPMAPLHRLNPLRVRYIRDHVSAHFGRAPVTERPLAGLTMLDIGCGAGILSEPLARLGAQVTGIDPAAKTIAAAAWHATASGLAIDYRTTTIEDVATEAARFDVVLAMEVVEHVADVPAFLTKCAAAVRPGGLFVLATLNRTPKAFVQAIVGAEYVLGWLPRGTHRWSRFVRPSEVARALRAAGLVVVDIAGVDLDPRSDGFRLVPRPDVNYMLVARAPEAAES